MKDYYRTLGILDDAEEIIVKAAYRALAQRYHPDKWSGDQSDATKRMSEINEAYGVLSDSNKRTQYDRDFFKFKSRNQESDEPTENFDEEELDEIDEAWILASEFYSSIKVDFEELRKINSVLANTFKMGLVESKKFDQSLAIKKKYEQEYLKKYYGENEYVRSFAKFLLTNNQKKAAVRVNTIVRLMGGSATYTQIFDKILIEFPKLNDICKEQFIIPSSERTWDALIKRHKENQSSDEDIAYFLVKKYKCKVEFYSEFKMPTFIITKGRISISKSEAKAMMKKQLEA